MGSMKSNDFLVTNSETLLLGTMVVSVLPDLLGVIVLILRSRRIRRELSDSALRSLSHKRVGRSELVNRARNEARHATVMATKAVIIWCHRMEKKRNGTRSLPTVCSTELHIYNHVWSGSALHWLTTWSLTIANIMMKTVMEKIPASANLQRMSI